MRISFQFYHFTELILMLLTIGCQNPEKQPNIIFFLADDLGWRDLGCFGSTYSDTPNINELAENCMLFTNAYSAKPWYDGMPYLEGHLNDGYLGAIKKVFVDELK